MRAPSCERSRCACFKEHPARRFEPHLEQIDTGETHVLALRALDRQLDHLAGQFPRAKPNSNEVTCAEFSDFAVYDAVSNRFRKIGKM